METLKYIYEGLKELELVTDQKSFSTDWLLRSPHYYAMLISSGKKPSITSMVNLGCRLKEIHTHFSSSNLMRERAAVIYPYVTICFNSFYSRVTEKY